MKIDINLIKKLREETGLGIGDCKKALEANNSNIEKSKIWLREKGIAKAIKQSDKVAAEGAISSGCDTNKCYILELNSQTDFVAQNIIFKNLLNSLETVIFQSNITTLEELLNCKINNTSIENYILEVSAKIGEKINLRRLNIYTKKDSYHVSTYTHTNSKIGAIVMFDKDISPVLAKQVAMHITAIKPLVINKNDYTNEYIDIEKGIILKQMAKMDKPDNIKEKIAKAKLEHVLKENSLMEQNFVVNNKITVKDALKGAKVISFHRYLLGEGIEKINTDFRKEVYEQANNS